MVPKYLAASSLAMQRASIEAAAALMSSGNSRNTKRTLPASTYFDCSIGNTFSWNAAQCGQLIEAYSTMVTGAFALPTAMSGKDTGLAASTAVAFCAKASPIRGWGAKQARAKSPTSDRAPARAGRMAVKGLLRKAVVLRPLPYQPCANLKRLFWRWWAVRRAGGSTRDERAGRAGSFWRTARYFAGS